MIKIKFDADLLKTIMYFEQSTRTKVRDCIEGDDNFLFVVEENELGKALGKNAQNVKRISAALKKKVKVVEYSPDPLKFVRNLIYPLKVRDVEEKDGIITITDSDTTTKGLIIGRNAANLRRTEGIVQRYFPIKEIKVV